MSKKHPIIAVTGSSGAGTTTVRSAFEHIFFREKVVPAIVQGDSFHRFDRHGMRKAVTEAIAEGRYLSHFGIDGNHFDKLEECFRLYANTGSALRRFYNHTDQEADSRNGKTGEFTPWENIEAGTEVLFYEGLHGGLVDGEYNIAQHVDLLVGVVPIVNLEWIQKIHRDTEERGYDPRDVTENILRRMPDYVHYITPQFSLTDVNFQRVPTVDTSNPFTARDIPTLDESFVVIRFKDPEKLQVDFQYLLSMLHDAFMSRPNTMVVPGGKMGLAIELIFTPLIIEMMRKRNQASRNLAVG